MMKTTPIPILEKSKNVNFWRHCITIFEYSIQILQIVLIEEIIQIVLVILE